MFRTNIEYSSDQTFCGQPLNYGGYFYIPAPSDKSISVAIYKDEKQPPNVNEMYNKLFKSLKNMKNIIYSPLFAIDIHFKKRNTEPRS